MNCYLKLLLCLWSVLAPLNLSAQQSKVDSLKSILSASQKPIERTGLLNSLAREFQRISADSSIYYASSALEESEKLDYTSAKLDALVSLTIANTDLGKFEEGKTWGKAGLKLAIEVDDAKKAMSLSSNIGRAYARQGSFHGALFYFKQAMEFNNRNAESSASANLYNSIATVYVLLQEYELATEHYEKALSSYGSEPNKRSLSMLYNNMGASYAYQKSWKNALDYYERSLKINQEAGFPCLEISQVYNMGEIYLELGDLQNAKTYLTRSRELSESCENNAIYGFILFNLGKLEARSGNDDKAIELFNQAMLWINTQQSHSDINQMTKEIYEFYRDRGYTERALYYLELHSKAKDSVSALADIQKIALLTSEYEFEKERESLKAEQERAELILQSDLSRQRLFKYLGIIVALLFVLLAANYYRTSVHRKGINKVLQEKNVLVQTQKESLIEKTKELTKANGVMTKLHEFKETLTHMIAHDLKNALNSILVLSGKVKNREMQIIHQSGAQALGLITNMLDVHKFEDTAMDLNIDQQSISSLLKDVDMQVFLLLEFKKLKLVTELDHDILIPMDKDVMSRVLVNLLTNAIKYSSPGQEIHLKACFKPKNDGDSEALIELQDFGEGINAQDLPHVFDKYWQSKSRNLNNDVSTGLGLTFCKMAVEAHKGTISANSTLNRGTSFIITLPALEEQPLEQTIACDRDGDNEAGKSSARRTLTKLKPFALKFKDMQVHEVSRIRDLLEEVRNLGIETDWPREVELAMYQGNQQVFEELLEPLLD